PNNVSLEQARAHGAITAVQEQTAELATRKRSLVARLFGGRREADEAADEASAAAPSATTTRGRVTVASAEAAKPVETQRIVPMPAPRPKAAVAIAAAKPAPDVAGAPYVLASVG